jgi:methylthioribose-1-phosphate isomerase
MLAYAANDQGIPLYVVCGTNKFNVLNYLGHKIQLEENPPEEVADLEGINIRNPYFEVVPKRLINGIITEQGLMNPMGIKKNMKEISKQVKPLLL